MYFTCVCSMCIFSSRTTIVLFRLRAIKINIHESRSLEKSKWIAFPLKQSQLHTSLHLFLFSKRKEEYKSFSSESLESRSGARTAAANIRNRKDRQERRTSHFLWSRSLPLSFLIVPTFVYYYSSYSSTWNIQRALPASLPNLR